MLFRFFFWYWLKADNPQLEPEPQPERAEYKQRRQQRLAWAEAMICQPPQDPLIDEDEDVSPAANYCARAFGHF